MSRRKEPETKIMAAPLYTPAVPRPVPPGLARLRVPEGATDEQAKLADRALQRVEDVLEERVHHSNSMSVLAAVKMIRDEICGPIPKDLNIKGEFSLQELVRKIEEREKEIE